jgi:hypothetical protein
MFTTVEMLGDAVFELRTVRCRVAPSTRSGSRSLEDILLGSLEPQLVDPAINGVSAVEVRGKTGL